MFYLQLYKFNFKLNIRENFLNNNKRVIQYNSQ